MGFVQANQACLRKYFVLSGRATKAELWWFWLAHVLVPVALIILATAIGPTLPAFGTLLLYAAIGYYLLTIPPLYCAVTRRFHDIGRTGKNSFLFIVALLIVMAAIYVSIGQIMSSMTVTTLAEPSAALYALPGLVAVDAIMLGVFFFFITLPMLIVALIPFVIIATMLVRPSQPGPNEHGPNPYEVSP